MYNFMSSFLKIEIHNLEICKDIGEKQNLYLSRDKLFQNLTKSQMGIFAYTSSGGRKHFFKDLVPLGQLTYFQCPYLVNLQKNV